MNFFDHELLFKIITLVSILVIAVSFYNLEKRFFKYSKLVEETLKLCPKVLDSKEFQKLKEFRADSIKKTNKYNLTRFK